MFENKKNKLFEDVLVVLGLCTALRAKLNGGLNSPHF